MLSKLKEILKKLKYNDKLHFEWVKISAGSLVLKNPKEDLDEIKGCLRHEMEGDEFLNKFDLNYFTPSEELFFIIINKKKIKQTKYYLRFKTKFQNELPEEYLNDAENWLSQFPFFDWKIYALKLLSNIIYVNDSKIEDSLKQIKKYIENLDDFVISDIEGIAKSSVHFFYPLNKILDIDKNNIILSKNLKPSDNRDIVFIDDMIGTGDQAIRYIEKLKNKNRIGTQKLYYYAIVGLSDGIEKIQNESLFENVEVVEKIDKGTFDHGHIFSSEDAGNAKKMVRNIGQQLTKNIKNIGPFGYGNSGALVFFRYNTPNNSLPIFWANGTWKILEEVGEETEVEWISLFPRKEKQESPPKKPKTPREISIENLKKIIQKETEKDEITDIKVQILMLIIENGKKDFIGKEKEISKIIDTEDLNSFTNLKEKSVNEAIQLLSKEEKCFRNIGTQLILKLNEFQQKIKEYLFSRDTDVQDVDFTYILNKIDQDKEAISYISDSFNFLDTEKPEYEPYTLANEVQSNETIRIMSYHYRYALTRNQIMDVFRNKLKQKVKIKILLMHPYSNYIRLPQTRNEIIQATSNLLDIAIDKESKFLEVRYYGSNQNIENDLSNMSKYFLFRGHIYGDRAIAFIPYPSKNSDGKILGDPYYLAWDAQKVQIFKSKDENSLLNIIELHQNYFDNIWYYSSTTLNEFLNVNKMDNIDNDLYEQLNVKFNSYNKYKNICNWYDSKEDIEEKILRKELVQIQIHPTNRCNLNCSFCFYNDRDLTKDNLDIKINVLENIIEDIKKYNGLRVIFSGGGEPTSYPGIESIISLCKKNGLAIGVITNGYFLLPFYNCIMENFRTEDFIRFSLDSGSYEKFKEIKGNGGIYDQIIKNIKEISEDKNRIFEVSIGYAIGKINCSINEIFSFLDFLRNNIQSEIKIIFRPIIDISNEPSDKNEVLDLSQISILLNNMSEIEKRIPINVKHNLEDFKIRLETLKKIQEKGIKENQCYVVHSGPIIESDGSVYPCHISSKLSRIDRKKFGSEIEDEYSIGKVTENNDFSKIWNEFNEKYSKKAFCCDISRKCNPRDIALNNKLMALK